MCNSAYGPDPANYLWRKTKPIRPRVRQTGLPRIRLRRVISALLDFAKTGG